MASVRKTGKKARAKAGTFDSKSKQAFDWTRFTLKVFVKAPPDAVWEAWTIGEKLSSWFPVAGTIEPCKGGRVLLKFFRPEDTLDAKVISAVKGRRLVFPFGPKGERVEVRVKEHQGGTICTLTQSGMGTGPRDKIYWHMGCRAGWVFFLTNLKARLEYGIDLRTEDPKMTYREGFVNS